jgi:hypothetical protein
VTGVTAATALVAAVKEALEDPAGTVTDAGTAIEELAEATETLSPPLGAIPFSETVPTVLSPPSTEDGETVNPTRLDG